MGVDYRVTQSVLVKEDFSEEVVSKLTDKRKISRS